MIIDVHTHVFEEPSKTPYNRPSGIDDLLREMDANRVDRSILIPLPGWATNEYIHRLVKAHPDRLSGLYTPDFTDLGSTISRMEVFFTSHRPCGLKIHPRVQNVTVSHEMVRTIVGWAGNRGLPVVFDVFPFGPQIDNLAMMPLAYNGLARDFRNTTILLAHAGGFRPLDAFMVAKANPNVVIDISFTPLYFEGASIEQDITFLCNRMPDGRVMYGSDFPSQDFSKSLTKAREVMKNVPADKVSAILSATAVRVFKL